MPHTVRQVCVFDADGLYFYVARKIGRWLVDNGRAVWMNDPGHKGLCEYPGKLRLVYPAKEPRGSMSGGAIVMQIVTLRKRLSRG